MGANVRYMNPVVSDPENQSLHILVIKIFRAFDLGAYFSQLKSRLALTTSHMFGGVE